jgi:metal-sulfur cluster biosynthetic enzyme
MVGAAAVLRTVPVAFTTAPTDLDYKLMVAGGVLLFGGLGVFSVQVCASMFGWRPPELFTRKAPLADDPAAAAPVLNGSANGSAPATPIRRDGPVTADMTIAAALAAHPIVLELLLKRGFGPLATPETRDAMAPITTIERAAPFVGSSSEDLVAYINDGIANAAAEAGEVAPAAPGIALTMIETPVTKQDVMQALESCYDPEVPVNIVDLGLVYDVLVRDDYARVTMSMTSPGCPAADMLEADVRKALRAVEGIATVDVEVVDEPAWTAERISPAGRVRLGMG